jgi:hypothetical protein
MLRPLVKLFIYFSDSFNRSVYAWQLLSQQLQEPVGGSGCVLARSFRFAQTFGLNIPTDLEEKPVKSPVFSRACSKINRVLEQAHLTLLKK